MAIAFGGVRALDGVSLSIARGEIFGLIGPNGSGKTTLVNCITRIYTPQSGRLVFSGRPIVRLAPFEVARLGIARTFQNINLVDEMSALDNVAVARADRRGGLERARREAMHYLEELDVGALCDAALRGAGVRPETPGGDRARSRARAASCCSWTSLRQASTGPSRPTLPCDCSGSRATG